MFQITASLSYKGAVIQVLGMSTLSNKELCSMAFDCQIPPHVPVVTWNVTFPDRPKPTPRPPQPPAVCGRIFYLRKMIIFILF
jgi:hypothetical protein